ncbi:MAG: NADPH-dependent F420 reductase [Acidimicrobiia bacterium]
MKIGVLGGTGPLGQGLAVRFADQGHDVVLGSRDAAKSEVIVSELQEQWGSRLDTLTPGANADAAATDMVVLATVWDAAVATATDLADQLDGRIVICVANGLTKVGKQFSPVLPPEGSIAAAVQAAAPGARVIAAFQHIPAAALRDLDGELEGDVLVAGDDDDARNLVIDLVDDLGTLRGLDVGGLVNAQGIETFAAAMLTVNLRYKGESTLHLGGVGAHK